MATNVDVSVVDGATAQERFAQLARAGSPFNPVGGEEIGGANRLRLLAAMKSLRWADPRFVTREQAEVNSWAVEPGAISVQATVRDDMIGSVGKVALFNATNVLGMPSMAAMLAMTDAEIAVMRGATPQADIEVDSDSDLSIGPAHSVVREVGGEVALAERMPIESAAPGANSAEPIAGVELAKTTTQGQEGQAADAMGAGIEGQTPGDDTFAVMAAYWQNGLHNPKGVALAKEINKAILDNKLGKDREAIARLMEVYPSARRLGIEIVTERQYLGDPHLHANVAEPKTLLGGALVRDKVGDYRPAGGGLPVLQDKGDTLTLKSKSADGYRAAMELALAKGWTAIELKGKPAMLASAWLEAKMLGLDVVNYAPTENDKLKYAERVAEASKAKAAAAEAEQARAAAEGPEMVEVRPYVGADGLAKTATATVTVAQEHGSNAVGEAVVGPAVVRTVVRAGDVVESDVDQVAAVDVGAAAHQVAENIVEAELGQAIAAVTEGEHVGPIVEIKDGFVGQKIGRDPKEIRWHDVSKFAGRVPGLGEVAEISYTNGAAKVAERDLGQGVGR